MMCLKATPIWDGREGGGRIAGIADIAGIARDRKTGIHRGGAETNRAGDRVIGKTNLTADSTDDTDLHGSEERQERSDAKIPPCGGKSA
jgi:hypothetical protein